MAALRLILAPVLIALVPATAQERTMEGSGLTMEHLLSPEGAAMIDEQIAEARERNLAETEEEGWAERNMQTLARAAREALPNADIERIECADARCDIALSFSADDPTAAMAAAERWLAETQPCGYRFSPEIGADLIAIEAETDCSF